MFPNFRVNIWEKNGESVWGQKPKVASRWPCLVWTGACELQNLSGLGKSWFLDPVRLRGQLPEAGPLSRVSRGSSHCFSPASSPKSPTHGSLAKFKFSSLHLMENFHTTLKKPGTKICLHLLFPFLISFFTHRCFKTIFSLSVSFRCCSYI